MEGGHKNGKGMNMINTDTELILQHSGPLIAHAYQDFLPPHLDSRIHSSVDEQAQEQNHHDPQKQQLGEPSPIRPNECVPSFVVGGVAAAAVIG